MELQYVRVALVKEKEVRYPYPVFNSQCCHEILKEVFADADREMFVVVCLNGGLNIAAINIVSVGDLEQAQVHPREVFKPAILSNAARVILAHNHPGGDPKPSKEDIEVAKRIAMAGQILGIHVEDFIVWTDSSHYSLSQRRPGLLFKAVRDEKN